MSGISPDDIVWRTPLLHPPKSQTEADLIQYGVSSMEPQVGARCLEMAGGPALEWRVVVSERSVPDGKQEVRIRNPKLSSSISQPLLPPVALDPTMGGGARVHFQSSCLSLCVVPDASSLQNPQKTTTLWCGWSSGHVSVHYVGGKAAGEVVECFVAHRGGPVRLLKSMSCERHSSSAFYAPKSSSSSCGGGGNDEANTINNNNTSTHERGAESVLMRLVCSASSDFAVTLWDSQTMRALKSIQLGAALGIVRTMAMDRFSLYSNTSSSSSSSTTTPILTRSSLCIIGADNGSLVVIDCKKEIVGNNESSTTTAPRGPRNSSVSLVNQRTAVTSLAVLHFPDAPSVCVSGSDGGVVRAQALAAASANASASSTLSLQHGAVNAIAVLPTSSLPHSILARAGGGGGSSASSGTLTMAACATGRIFLILIGAGGAPPYRPNSSEIAPLVSAMASFNSPTGPIVQLCSRPAWSRAVYAVTSSGAVDLYSSTEAVLARIDGKKSSAQHGGGFFVEDGEDDYQQQPQAVVVAPAQLKAKAASLIMQCERRYEQNLQLMLDLAVESKRHCEMRDGAILKLKAECDEKTRLLEAMVQQCEALSNRTEQLRSENSRLGTERSAIMEHAMVANSEGAAARSEMETISRELQASADREGNSEALMDALRLRVMTLERDLDKSLTNQRHLEQQCEVERQRTAEMHEALMQSQQQRQQQSVAAVTTGGPLHTPPPPPPQSGAPVNVNSNNSNVNATGGEVNQQQQQLLEGALNLPHN